jgi:hypothetical protein
MINLRERAILAKGKTIISSTPGKGTKVTLTVPIDIAEPEPEGEDEGEMTQPTSSSEA